MCRPASAQQVRDRARPRRGGTLSQDTERCWVVVTFSPARQTQTLIVMGQSRMEIPAFPISSRQQPHKSQELQRGSSIRRYLRHRGGSAGCEPVGPRCLSRS